MPPAQGETLGPWVCPAGTPIALSRGNCLLSWTPCYLFSCFSCLYDFLGMESFSLSLNRILFHLAFFECCFKGGII